MMVVVGWDGINGNIMQGREHRREREFDRKEKQSFGHVDPLLRVSY